MYHLVLVFNHVIIIIINKATITHTFWLEYNNNCCDYYHIGKNNSFFLQVMHKLVAFFAFFKKVKIF